MKQNWKNAWILMRIPFSLFLMPVFWLSVASLPIASWKVVDLVSVFSILHLLLYPASNGYNSLIDGDEDSVGGLKSPPPVGMELSILVLIFDFASVMLPFLVNVYFGFFVCVYWLVSKAYSHPVIRLKKFPLISWFVVAVFQGGWTVGMVWMGLSGNESVPDQPFMWAWPLAASLLLAGSYPLTQVYQHASDRKRGDRTLSLLLGVRGTFAVAGFFLPLGSSILAYGLIITRQTEALWVLLACSIPAFLYFFLWIKKVLNDSEQADFENTMRFNQISSLGLSLGFILWLCMKIFGISFLLHP